jgi:hypothetical protein
MLGCEARLEGLDLSLLGSGSIETLVLELPGAAAHAPPLSLVVDGVHFTHAPVALLSGRLRLVRIRARTVWLQVSSPLRVIDAVRLVARTFGGDTGLRPEVELERVVVLSSEAKPGAAPRGGSPLLEVRDVKLSPSPGGERRWRLRGEYRRDPVVVASLDGIFDLDSAHAQVQIRASNLPVESLAVGLISEELAVLAHRLRPRGPIDLDLELDYPWNASERAALTGTVGCYALTLQPDVLPVPLTNIAGELHIDGPRLEIPGLRGVYAGGVIRARGAVADALAAEGIMVELNAHHLPLEAVQELKLGDWGPAIRALGARGRGGGRLAIVTGAGQPLSAAELDVSLGLDDATLLGGAFASAHGTLSLRGAFGAEQAYDGALRLERAELFGVPLRSLSASARLGRDGLLLRDIDGRLADGRVRATASLSPDTAGGRFEVEAEVSGARLQPVLRALGLNASTPDLTASGRVHALRGGAAGSGVESVARFEGVELRGVPRLRPLVDLLEASGLSSTAFDNGTVELRQGVFDTEHEAGSSLRLDLESPAYDFVVVAHILPDGAIAGEAVAERHDLGDRDRYWISGTTDRPLFQSPLR